MRKFMRSFGPVALMLGLAAVACTAVLAQQQGADDRIEVENTDGKTIKADDIKINADTPRGLLEVIQYAGVDAQSRRDLPVREQFKLYAFTTIKAADKLLDLEEASDDQKSFAKQAKLSALLQGMSFAPDLFAEQAEKFAKTLVEEQPDSPLAAVAATIPYRLNVLGAEGGLPENTVKEAAALVKKYPSSPAVTGMVTQTIEELAQNKRVDQAEQLLESAMETYRDENSELAKQLDGLERKLQLYRGEAMELSGPTLQGEDLSLEQLRGKVVLVDFWATWCGPCVAELPNLQEVYKKYNDKGFEVVAVSLDNDREKLEMFVKENNLAWPQIYVQPPQGARGWENPLADKYGISAIPAMFLLDREGKLITTELRGEGTLEEAVKQALQQKKPTPAG